ncbi:sialate:O-sulfotransferase 1 [Gasterosteus aculeatus]|uniref:WSC domain containing 1b n=1 Tax=Gasterosteus aculeatus aculeatus TaxID=481459 RepID=G3Q9R3_GASAC|nr:WSC domain-containing protein 1 [Gasterosteus aculeatus aculeatus]XP_040038339.1 WSC domain-containing protein 1 [Gasterosteus aculeatus aculeatus]XP_040038340.1 WSC domain-containing protein 1 [Gasterosteus aculeatus aculeatus]
MATPHYRLQCLLKRAQMLLLGLGIAYLMAGSILLLQRSSVRVAQPNLAGLPPLLALAAPPTVLRAWFGPGVRARSRWAAAAAVQPASGGGTKAGRQWPASQSLGVQHLHRQWFHSLLPESPEQRVPLHRSSKHKGTYMGCYLHNASDRALGGTMLYDLRKMTSSLCQDTCSESGYQFAGLEFGADCHCGNRISSTRAPEEDCGLVCRGERGSPCGGVGRLSIYKVDGQLPGHRKFRNVHYRGCFKLTKSTIRTFPIDSFQPNLTTQSCIETCTDKELPLAVFKKPHCFCTWTPSLFSLNQQSDNQQCVEQTGLNHTGNSTAVAPTELAHYQVYHTPVLDSMCKERMFLPQRSSSLVALSSFPGAGNTWVRHLIELVTGYYTGSFYFDGTLYNRGFKGEKDYWKSGRSICVKTHESGQKEIEMFDSSILLIRNPYRSLVAEFNRKCAGHLGHATDAQWKSKEWPEFVSSYAPWWASHALSWLKFGRRLLVVHYEELQRALLPQLRVITAFLNATITEERLLCAQSNQDGHFKRSGASSFDPFTPDMRRMIDPLIRSVDQALHSRNFSGLPQEYLPR